MLVGRVDNSIGHGAGCFDDVWPPPITRLKSLPQTATISILIVPPIARNNGYILANQVELAGTSSFTDLPETITGGTPPSQHPAYPLKLVGSATSSGDRVGAVVEIDLQLNSTPTTTPTITPTITPTPTVTGAPAWDLNGDHVCDIGDVVILGLHWGQKGTPGWIPEDLNNDGVIDIGDVVVLGLHWGQTW